VEGGLEPEDSLKKKLLKVVMVAPETSIAIVRRMPERRCHWDTKQAGGTPIMDTNTQKQDKGFTLVELLIVIVILGILATVTVFAVRGITDKGQKSACAADAKTLSVAVEAYFAQNGGTTIPGTDPTATLKSSGLLRDVSTNYSVDANGALAPIGTTCPAV
jgi:prepilin-type N-terminal cleavage/methylation domain-containing protein